MMLKYGIEIDPIAIQDNLIRLINQIYKLLPEREEKKDWKKTLDTILEELAGMHSLFNYQPTALFKLVCKLEGLHELVEDTDFLLYRKIIFECISLCNEIKEWCNEFGEFK